MIYGNDSKGNYVQGKENGKRFYFDPESKEERVRAKQAAQAEGDDNTITMSPQEEPTCPENGGTGLPAKKGKKGK